jgi:hypothetical protein
MRRLGLRWEVYLGHDLGLVARVQASPTGWTWEWKRSHETEEIDEPGFVRKLQAIETEKWCNLYLCASMAKEGAIAAGIEIVEPVTEVYRALLPLYEASTRRTGSGGGRD